MSRAVSIGSGSLSDCPAVPFCALVTGGFGDDVERETVMRRKATVKAPLEDPSKLFELAQSCAIGRSANFGSFAFSERSTTAAA
jgi:hypothetical protein